MSNSVFLILMLFLQVILPLVGLASRILFACAAYQDAKANGNRDATMWGVLIGILGLIPGIVYLCIRKKQNSAPIQQICVACRAPLVQGTSVCPYCGAAQPNVTPWMFGVLSPEEQEYRARLAKRLLIAACICLAVGVLLIIVSVESFVGLLASNFPNGYYDSFGNFDNFYYDFSY